jgi:hypothetical protein
VATKNKTKIEKTPLTLNDRMDKIQEMVEMLNSDIFEGNITTNEITDQLEQISIKRVIQDRNQCPTTNP